MSEMLEGAVIQNELEPRWYALRGFHMYINKDVLNILSSAGLSGLIQEMEGPAFKPKDVTITLEQAKAWASENVNGEANLNNLYKYL